MIIARRACISLLILVALATGCSSTGTGDRVGSGLRVVQEKLLAASPGGRLEQTDQVVAGFAGNGPEVLFRSDKGWFAETLEREPGFVTDVVRVGDMVVAVGATGTWTLPSTFEGMEALKPVIWTRAATGAWARAPLPSTGPGWLTGVAKTNTDVVAVGRTIGADGDAYALRSDHALQAWTMASLGTGPGLQLVSTVAANATSFVAFGVVEGADPPPFPTALWTSADGQTWTASPNPNKVSEQIGVLRPDGSVLAVGGADRRVPFPQTHVSQYPSAGGPSRSVDLGELDAIGVQATASIVAAVAIPRLRNVNDRVWFFPTLMEGTATRVELPINAKDVLDLRVVRGSVLDSGHNLYFAVKTDRGTRVYQIEHV
jgi:hypothetical protein